MDIITGDVHQKNYHSKEHKAFDVYKVVPEYLQIIESAGLTCLLFITGKCLEENPQFWKDIIKRGHKLGFHTYDAFQNFKKGQGLLNKWIHGCNYGSKKAQETDITKCTNLSKKHNLEIVDWRTHEYASNKTTKQLLKKHGFLRIYDRFDLKENPTIKTTEGITDLPNTFPDDHNTVHHKLIKDQRQGMMSNTYYTDKIERLYKPGRLNIIQCHPMCQKTIDNFESFKKIVKIFKEGKI